MNLERQYLRKNCTKRILTSVKENGRAEEKQKIREEQALGSSDILRGEMWERGRKCQNGLDKFSLHYESNKKVTW